MDAGPCFRDRQAGRGKRLNLRLNARFDQDSAELVVSADSLDSLLKDPENYALEASLSMDSIHAAVDGEIRHPLSAPSFRGEVSAESDQLQQLFSRLDVEGLPIEQARLELEGTLDTDRVEIRKAEGELDEITLDLDGAISWNRERPHIRLRGIVDGLAIVETSGDQDSDQSSDFDLDQDIQAWLDPLQAFDASVDLRFPVVGNAYAGIEVLQISGTLVQGRVEFPIVSASVNGLKLEGALVAETALTCPSLEFSLQGKEIDSGWIKRLGAPANWPDVSSTSLSLQSESCGTSVYQHLDSMVLQVDFTGVEPAGPAEGLDWHIDRAELEASHRQNGRVSIDGNLDGRGFSASASTGPLSVLFDGRPWAHSLGLRGAGLDVEWKGDLEWSEDAWSFSGLLGAGVDRLGQLNPWTAISRDADLPASLRMQVSFAPSAWSVREIKGSLGASMLRGSLSQSVVEGTSTTVARVRADRIVIEELTRIFESSPESEDPPDSIMEDTQWVREWLGTPSLDYSITIDELVFPRFTIDDFSSAGKISDGLVQGGGFSMALDGVDFRGELDADFRSPQWQLEHHLVVENLDIGRLLSGLELSEGLSASSRKAELNVVSHGSNLSELLSHSTLVARVEGFSWADEAPVIGERTDLLLDNIDLEARPGRHSMWSGSGSLGEVPVEFHAQTPDLVATFSPTAELPFSLAIAAANEVVLIEADLKRKGSEMFNADFRLTGERFAQVPDRLETLEYPLADYAIEAALEREQTRFRISDLSVQLPQSELNGEFDVDFSRNPIHIVSHFSSPRLETDDLVEFTRDWRSAQDQSGESDEEPTADITQDESAFVALISDEVDRLSERLSLDLSVTVEKLYSAGSFLGEAEMGMRIREHDFVLSPLRIRSDNSNLEAEYSSSILDGLVDLKLSVQADRLRYGGLARLLDVDATADGELFLETRLESTGMDWPDLNRRLQGHFGIFLIPEDAAADFLDLWASNLILAILPGTGKKKTMNCMVGEFEVSEGVMKSKTLLLDSTDVIIRGFGEIDLGQRQLDLVFAPDAKTENFFSVSAPVRVKGPFDDIEAGIKEGGFIGTLFRWYINLIYVPWKWLTGERYAKEGLSLCLDHVDWENSSMKITTDQP